MPSQKLLSVVHTYICHTHSRNVMIIVCQAELEKHSLFITIYYRQHNYKEYNANATCFDLK